MAQQRGSLRKRGEGTYQLRVTVHGQKQERTVPAKSEAEAKVRLAEFAFELGQAPNLDARTMTVEELAAHYWAICSPTLEGSTQLSTRRILDTYVIGMLGHYPVADLTVPMLRRWFAEIANGSRSASGRPMSASTLRKIKAPLSRMMALALEDGLVATNIVRNLPLPKVVPSDPTERVPERDQLTRLVRYCATVNPELARALHLKAVTGARRGELCALRWGDVDLDAGTVRIARAIGRKVDGDEYEKQYPKGRHRRNVTIGAATVSMLREHRRAMLERALACGVPFPPDAFVFSDEGDCGRWWYLDVFSERWRRVALHVGLDGHRLHDLRHFFVTALLDEGLPVHDVMRAAGHGSLEVTNRYAQARDANPAVGEAMARAVRLVLASVASGDRNGEGARYP